MPPLAGLKFAMLPFFSEKGGCNSHRIPKFKVKLLEIRHSSCAYAAKCWEI